MRSEVDGFHIACQGKLEICAVLCMCMCICMCKKSMRSEVDGFHIACQGNETRNMPDPVYVYVYVQEILHYSMFVQDDIA